MRLLSRYTMTPFLALLLVSLLTAGCGGATTAKKPLYPCPSLNCRVVIPPCQPPALLGMGMPQDAAAQLGFRPYVATWLPDAVTWYTAQVYPSAPTSVQLLPSQPRPLMRLGYGYLFPRPYHSYALHGVIAFDETTQALGLTTNIYVPGQTLAITSQSTVDINGRAATLFELQSSSGKNQTHVIGVEWQVGTTLWVRVTALTSGRYALLANGEGDDVVAWDGTTTDEVLRVARSARVYIGCDSNTPSAR